MCDHIWVRYVLTDEPTSHRQADGAEGGLPYRDVPLLPGAAFAYAESFVPSSEFPRRVVSARCRECAAPLYDRDGADP